MVQSENLWFNPLRLMFMKFNQLRKFMVQSLKTEAPILMKNEFLTQFLA